VTPISHWIYFHVAIILLMLAEFGLHKLFPDPRRKAIYAVALWTTAALALAAILAPAYKSTGAVQYLAGYAIEQALSIDNLFVFLLLFRLFRIPEIRQPKVLFWGVAGAIVMRGAFIAGGLSLLTHFHWIEYVFGAILLYAAIRLLKPEDENAAPPGWLNWLTRLHPVSDRTDVFLSREPVPPSNTVRLLPTVLLLALIAVELTDVVFALDSIPAVLSITRVPFLAYTSNIMAVMGLRSLYVLLAEMLKKLRYMHLGLAAILAFAALKMLAADWINIGPIASLVVIATLLALTIGASLLHKPEANTAA
jgi:tellurite resistance protein TerC